MNWYTCFLDDTICRSMASRSVPPSMCSHTTQMLFRTVSTLVKSLAPMPTSLTMSLLFSLRQRLASCMLKLL